MIPIHGFCRMWHVLDKDRGVPTLGHPHHRPTLFIPPHLPRRRPTRGVDADNITTHAESEAKLFLHQPVPYRRSKVGPGWTISEKSKVTCQDRDALTSRNEPYQNLGRPMCRCTTSASESGTLRIELFSPPCGRMGSGPLHDASRVTAEDSRHFTSSGLKSSCGFVPIRTSVYAPFQMGQPHVSIGYRNPAHDQTADATARYNRANCVPAPIICKCKAPTFWTR